MINIDATQLPLIDRTFRQCKVIALATTTPGYVVVEFAGTDNARLSAWWNGFPPLAVDDYVRVQRIGEDGQLVIVGHDAGTSKPVGARVTETFTGTDTMADTTEVGICNSAGAMTLTLPTHKADKEIRIININAGTVTLSPTSGNIKGAASESLYQWESLILLSDNTNWI